MQDITKTAVSVHGGLRPLQHLLHRKWRRRFALWHGLCLTDYPEFARGYVENWICLSRIWITQNAGDKARINFKNIKVEIGKMRPRESSGKIQ